VFVARLPVYVRPNHSSFPPRDFPKGSHGAKLGLESKAGELCNEFPACVESPFQAVAEQSAKAQCGIVSPSEICHAMNPASHLETSPAIALAVEIWLGASKV
jgi:hypothetical protein